MRKVIMSIMTIAVLTVALALPVVAATSNGRNCNQSLNWGSISAPAITQPTNCPSAVKQVPTAKRPTVRPVKGETEGCQLDLSQIMQQFGSQLGNCFSGLFGN
jgi:hypothetical protein